MLRDFIDNNRPWQWTEEILSQGPPPTMSGDIEFTLITYNILSQDLLQRMPSLYRNVHPDAKKWPERGYRICSEIDELNADIICLQEVHFSHHRQLYKPFLQQRGYQGIYLKRTGDKEDGCALYFRSTKFTLLEKVIINFYRPHHCSSMDRDNVAIIARLEPISNEARFRPILISTTHLLFSPNRGDIKLSQLRILLAEMNQMSITTDPYTGAKVACDIIICGDFNAEPDSPIHQFICSGKMNPVGRRRGDLSGQHEGRNRGQVFSTIDLFPPVKPNQRSNELAEGQNVNETVTHELNLASVYPKLDKAGSRMVSIASGISQPGLVDHIFYGKSDTLRAIAFKQLLNVNQLRNVRAMPNFHLGSDHFSLAARFLVGQIGKKER